jgi:hypothetical protein
VVDIDSVPPRLWLNLFKSKWPKNRKALETNHGDTETQRREAREAVRRTSLQAAAGFTWIRLDLGRFFGIAGQWSVVSGPRK